ncbi:putative MFS family arabinose efflux permease [Streptacidiphilus sp. EB129]
MGKHLIPMEMNPMYQKIASGATIGGGAILAHTGGQLGTLWAVVAAATLLAAGLALWRLAPRRHKDEGKP